MITFLRKIRRALLEAGSTKKYLLYAIGEILLVMIGILLALQVNNWNETRKNKKIEVKLYENLLSDLRGDSTDLIRVTNLVNRGLNAQETFIINSYDSLIAKYDITEIEKLVRHVTNVGISFFPRSSAYDQITNSGLLNLLRSEQIKNRVIELYERGFELYKHVDDVVEQKMQFHMHPITNGKLQTIPSSWNLQLPEGFDMLKFKNHHDELTMECRNSIWISRTSLNILRNIQTSVNELIELIDQELIEND